MLDWAQSLASIVPGLDVIDVTLIGHLNRFCEVSVWTVAIAHSARVISLWLVNFFAVINGSIASRGQYLINFVMVPSAVRMPVLLERLTIFIAVSVRQSSINYFHWQLVNCCQWFRLILMLDHT